GIEHAPQLEGKRREGLFRLGTLGPWRRSSIIANTAGACWGGRPYAHPEGHRQDNNTTQTRQGSSAHGSSSFGRFPSLLLLSQARRAPRPIVHRLHFQSRRRQGEQRVKIIDQERVYPRGTAPGRGPIFGAQVGPRTLAHCLLGLPLVAFLPLAEMARLAGSYPCAANEPCACLTRG